MGASPVEEALFHALFDAMPQLGWTAKPDGFIDYYNSGWYEYTGATYEQMQGWGWESVHDPDHLPRVLAVWKKALAKGQAVEFEFPLKRHDGVFRWFLTRIRPIHDGAGKLIRWVGINTDIQDQKAAQEEQRVQRARYSALFSQAPVAVARLAGPRHVIELANPLVCKIWGRSPAQLLDKPLLEALPEIEGQGFVELLDEVLRTGVARVGSETPARLDRRGDGILDTVWFNFVYEPLRDEVGRVEGIVVIAVDVTTQVAARRALAEGPDSPSSRQGSAQL